MTIFKTVLVNIHFVLTQKPVMVTIARAIIRTCEDFQLIAQEDFYFMGLGLYPTADYYNFQCKETFAQSTGPQSLSMHDYFCK